MKPELEQAEREEQYIASLLSLAEWHEHSSGLRVTPNERIHFERTEALKAGAAAIAALREMQWKPIESAPKDGTWILVCVPDEDCRYIAAFDEDCQFWFTDGNAEIESEITHWMPLPAPHAQNAAQPGETP